jgi:hypothetical protein
MGCTRKRSVALTKRVAANNTGTKIEPVEGAVAGWGFIVTAWLMFEKSLSVYICNDCCFVVESEPGQRP